MASLRALLGTRPSLPGPCRSRTQEGGNRGHDGHGFEKFPTIQLHLSFLIKIDHDEQTKRHIRRVSYSIVIVRNWEGDQEATQDLAAKLVIGKSIPDLKTVEHTSHSRKAV